MRASRLVAQLLSLSRVEPEAQAALHASVDLDVIVKAVVTEFSTFAEARRIDLGADIKSLDAENQGVGVLPRLARIDQGRADAGVGEHSRTAS